MTLDFVRLGKGRPLVVLHGLFGTSNNFLPLAKSLQDSFDLILADLRNHGHSPHDPDASVQAMASDILELIKALDLESIFLMGHSLGGRVAMRLALDHPGQIEKLLVADMAPKAQGPLFPEVFEALMSLDLTRLASRTDADDILKKTLPEAALRAFLLTNLLRDKQNAFTWKMNLAALNTARPGLGEAMASRSPYPHPALFLRGENSHYVLDSDQEGILALFPEAQIETIPGAGHWLHADQPSAFADAMRSFFGSA